MSGKHYGGGVIAAQERARAEATVLAKDLYDELVKINEAIKLSGWHDIGNDEKAKRILIEEGAVERIDKLLSRGFSWRVKL
jgi:hypothetical protein